MQRFVMIALMTFSLVVGLCDAPVMAAPPDRDAILKSARKEIYKTVNGIELPIYIFAPPDHQTTDKSPAIVFFFGGSWKKGSPAAFAMQCEYLASRGIVAMAADYRTESRHQNPILDCVRDGRSAMRWIRSHAAELGIDADRIAAGGGSAGGHVAACTALLADGDEPGEGTTVSCRPNALVLFNPVMNMAPFEFKGQDVPLGQKISKPRAGTEPVAISPLHQVKGELPPMLMMFGSRDSYLPGANTFDQLSREAGNRCELKVYDGYTHSFFNYKAEDPVPFLLTVRDADLFLNSLGYLSGPPTIEEWMQRWK